MAEDLGALEHGLTKKLGPLPSWAWAGVGAGTLVLFLKLRKHESSSATATTGATAAGIAPDLVGTYDSGSGAAADYSTDGGSAGASSAATGVTPAPTNDAQWAELAGDYLITNGAAVPTDVQNALADYLAGNPLTTAEQAFVNEALTLFGSPPEGVLASTLAPVTTTVPVTTTTTTPVTQTPGTVVTGTTFSGAPAVSTLADTAVPDGPTVTTLAVGTVVPGTSGATITGDTATLSDGSTAQVLSDGSTYQIPSGTGNALTGNGYLAAQLGKFGFGKK